jgi:thymidylate kinase
MSNNPKHIIFEGAELSGKSWLMSQVYDYLEPKYNKNRVILDGCHWFNCDVGVYGTKHGKPVIQHYCKILEELKNKNVLLEKFYISDIVYNRLHRNKEIKYNLIEKFLIKNNFKIVLCVFPDDEKILKQRIKERLSLYPHYERILREPSWYIEQQKEYLKEIKKTKLPCLVIEASKFPDFKLVKEILSWIGEGK